MKPEANVLSEEAFEAFGPQQLENGDLFEYRHVAGEDAHRVWSVVEGDGPYNHLYALPGFHTVNVMGYLTTDVPWTDEEVTAYWSFDDRVGFTALLADGQEIDEVGDDEADARERIELIWDSKVESIRLHDEEKA